MNYTKSKQELIEEIRYQVSNAISNDLNAIHYGSITSMGVTIQSAVTKGICKAFETLIDNTYTDQQFEEDMKLKI